uniref:Uncharacterized protein n=1 Tax=Anguilla anguilla TaxID=7936 RepID=A0A0E9SAR0_ANGAN
MIQTDVYENRAPEDTLPQGENLHPPRHKANNNLTYLAKFSRESVKTREINNHVN